jgi:hypothetical protein
VSLCLALDQFGHSAHQLLMQNSQTRASIQGSLFTEKTAKSVSVHSVPAPCRLYVKRSLEGCRSCRQSFYRQPLFICLSIYLPIYLSPKTKLSIHKNNSVRHSVIECGQDLLSFHGSLDWRRSLWLRDRLHRSGEKSSQAGVDETMK